MSLVSVTDLVVRFGEHEVLGGINLSLEKGETLALMASSGGGKTTALRCISGLQKPTSGSVFVGDIDVTEEPELARSKMSMVFQSAALFDFLSVLQNVKFGLERRNQPHTEGEILERSHDALAQVGLADDGDKMTSELSGGMKKRVGIARALVLDPELMLYDEPTTGLDPITTYHIDELMVELRERHGLSSILVSHDLSSVFRTANKIAFLDQGAVVFTGTEAEFKTSTHPAIVELIQKAMATSIAG